MQDNSFNQRFWITAPGEAAIHEEPAVRPGKGEIALTALFSGISRGTERLVFEGRVPPGEAARMRAPLQRGDFAFPVSYGYCLVGEAEDGLYFALHPHASRAVVPQQTAVRLPDDLPPRRAVLGANVETAPNAIWDSGAGPGDRIAVIGAGLVGGCVAAIAARLPGARVELVDIDPARARLAEALGCAFATPEAATPEADIVFHASASAAGLATGIALAGFEARIVEMSWYGDQAVPAPLGGAFHSQRLSLVSSQVGHVAPSRRPRWPHARRLGAALDILRDARFEALLGEDVPFRDLPAHYARILQAGEGGPCPVIRYD